ncbi:M23 family metallopeptidase [Serratia marcescens]|nr:M23 family metallopeptidase [Serratia marcescens]
MKALLFITLLSIPVFAVSSQAVNSSEAMSSPIRSTHVELLPTLEMRMFGEKNEPVNAVSEGTVDATEKKVGGVKNIIVIRHADNMISIYSNLDNILVKTGERVSKESILGYLGSGPNSALKFEIRKNGVNVDPNDYIMIKNSHKS